jgi:hypothetical protein
LNILSITVSTHRKTVCPDPEDIWKDEILNLVLSHDRSDRILLLLDGYDEIAKIALVMKY